jgi:hypothetical protein
MCIHVQRALQPAHNGDNAEQEANALLITAAPETAAERDRLREHVANVELESRRLIKEAKGTMKDAESVLNKIEHLEIVNAELLAALKAVLPHISVPTDGPDMDASANAYNRARTAIAEATTDDA